MKNLILFIFIAFFSPPLFSYTTNDQSYMQLLLPSTWSIQNQKQTDQIRSIVYKNNAINSRNEILFLDTMMKSGQISAALIYDGFKQKMEKAGCEVSNLITGGTHPFNKWTVTYQCKFNQTSGALLLIDADPINFYIISYQIQEYPFNKTMVDHLNAILIMCYSSKTNPTCFHILSGNLVDASKQVSQ